MADDSKIVFPNNDPPVFTGITQRTVGEVPSPSQKGLQSAVGVTPQAKKDNSSKSTSVGTTKASVSKTQFPQNFNQAGQKSTDRFTTEVKSNITEQPQPVAVSSSPPVVTENKNTNPDAQKEIQRTNQPQVLPKTFTQPQVQTNQPVQGVGNANTKAQDVVSSGPLDRQGEVNKPISKPTAPPSPKRKFPKIIFLPLILLPLIALIALLLKNFLPSGPEGVGKKGEITWWGLREEAVVTPLIEEYEENNPEIKIKYVKQSTQDYRERLTNAIAKGEGPDIIHFHNTWVPMFKNELDVLPEFVMSQQEFADTFYPIAVSDLTTDAGVVGIPLNYDAVTLYINEDIFALAAKSPPEDWDELRALAREMTQKNEKQIIQAGVAMGMTENIDHWQEVVGLMMIQNKANLAKPTGKLAQDPLTYYASIVVQDGGWDITLPASTQAFARGKVAMIFAPTYRANEIRKENPNLRFKTVLVPQLPKDNPAEPDASYATYWTEGVWNKSVNKNSAWDFLKFMSSRESLQKMHRNAESIGLFGEPYPRRDMALLLKEDPIAGSVIALAPLARGWYLVDDTHDGPTGINSQISSHYETAVNGVTDRQGAEKVIGPLSSGIASVLGKYGIKVK